MALHLVFGGEGSAAPVVMKWLLVAEGGFASVREGFLSPSAPTGSYSDRVVEGFLEDCKGCLSLRSADDFALVNFRVGDDCANIVSVLETSLSGTGRFDHAQFGEN